MKVLKRFNKKIYCLSCVFEINSVLLQTEISSKIVKGGFTVLLESEFLELMLKYPEVLLNIELKDLICLTKW